MIIGVPREIKKEEYRVSITPWGVEDLRKDGHTVLVETGAGHGSGFPDEQYLGIDADVVDAQRAQVGKGLRHRLRRMKTAHRAQFIGGERLHAHADAIDACREPSAGFFGGDCFGIGFQSDFFQGTVERSLHGFDNASQIGWIKQAGRSAADIDRVHVLGSRN